MMGQFDPVTGIYEGGDLEAFIKKRKEHMVDGLERFQIPFTEDGWLPAELRMLRSHPFSVKGI